MVKVWSDLAWNDYLEFFNKLSGYYSRRIDQKNRLVYKVEDNKLYIVQCGTHYQQ